VRELNAADEFLINDQPEAQFFSNFYFTSLHVSSNLVFIIRRINCNNTNSGMCHSVSVTVSCAGRKGNGLVIYQES